MNASKTANETAAVGGYGILASLDREVARGGGHATAPRDGRGARHALAAGAGLVALLAWWWCSNTTPAVTLAPKPVWHAPVARPAPATVPVPPHEQAALIVNDPQPAPPVAVRPAPAVAPVRRERVAAHVAARPPRRAAAPRVQAPAIPADHDVSLLTALVAHKNGVALPSRDVVEPRMADSTAVLLKRCSRVGGEEGRLCRVRICAGRAMDAACAGD